MLCKLEGEIVISTATVAGDFGGSPIIMPVGRYFLNSIGSGGATRSFCDELDNQLTVTLGGTWTVTVSDGTDTSTGVVTINRSIGIAYTVTWAADAAIRNILGFTGNLGSATSHTGTAQAKYLWLPNCGRSGIMAPDASNGAVETDYSFSMGTDGTPYALAYSTRYKDSMEFRTVKGSKSWISKESVVNESFERFYTDVIGYGMRVRYHADRSVDATYRTWVVEDGGRYAPATVREDWADGAESLWSFRYLVRKTT